MPRLSLRVALAAGLPALAAACTPPAPAASPGPAASPAAASRRPCAILSVNDTYRIEPLADGAGGLAHLRAVRARLQKEHPDLVTLHAGDFLSPSLLSRKYRGAHMIDVLNRLDGSEAFDPRLVVTFGNHEFDYDEPSVLSSRMSEAAFRLLSSNIEFARTADGTPKVGTHKIAQDVILGCGGYQLGIFAVTTDVKRQPYVTGFADPIETARAKTRSLRERGAQVVVGLTHLDMATDRRLLETLGAEGPDLLVGGHEHVKQRSAPGGRAVYKADADARTANFLQVSGEPGGLVVAHEWIDLPAGEPSDPELDAVVKKWLGEHERSYCQEKMSAPPGCLSEQLTVTQTRLLAEEYAIRRYESNLGNFVADEMLSASSKEGAQIAFINAGTLRLNYNIEKGAPVTRRVVEELFAYRAPLRVIRISGATLVSILSRAVSGWTGQGHFLQISGFAFRHDGEGNVRDLTLLGPKPRRIKPDETLLAVTTTFLLDPKGDQDGYTMIGPDDIVGPPELRTKLGDGPDLKELVVKAFRAAGTAGIAPAVQGRICHPEASLCLAL